MEYWVMRFLDKYVGIPICFLLHLHDLLITLLHVRKAREPLRKILIIKFWGIGSIILASPTLKALREAYPEQKIVLLTMDKNKGLYESAGLFDEVIYFKIEGLWEIAIDFLRLLAVLRKEKFDLILDLEPFCRFSAIVAYLSTSPRRISYDTKNQGRGWLYTEKIAFIDGDHIVKNFLSTLSL